MSYTKTNWHDGDTISAAKLNKLENGIENSLSTELQALYKTLAGKDYAGDPNPTDAEMIDAIAKDATSGGGSGLVITGRIASEDAPNIVVDPIAPNLTLNEFAQSTFVVVLQDKAGMVYPYIGGMLMGDTYATIIPMLTGQRLEIDYNPETGEVGALMQS